MAATNGPAFKLAFVRKFQPILYPVPVDYAYNGKTSERSNVYLGLITGPHEPMAFRSATRIPRKEELTVNVHVEVSGKNETPQETDAKAVAIGQLIEEGIAEDPKFGGLVPGLLLVTVSHTTLTSFFMEDGAAATQLLYQLNVQSMLS